MKRKILAAVLALWTAYTVGHVVGYGHGERRPR